MRRSLDQSIVLLSRINGSLVAFGVASILSALRRHSIRRGDERFSEDMYAVFDHFMPG
jgi:hypothetical protein